MTSYIVGCNHPECPPYITTSPVVVEWLKIDLEKKFKMPVNVYDDAGPGLILDFGGSVLERFDQIEIRVGENEKNNEPRRFKFWPHQLDFVVSEINLRLKESEGKDYVLLWSERWVLAMERRDVLTLLDKIRAEFAVYKVMDRNDRDDLDKARELLAGVWIVKTPVPAGEVV